MKLYRNDKAYFNYSFEDEITAGVVLTGAMVKAIRHGELNISEAFCRVIEEELFLFNVIFGGQVYNDIKLLVSKKEIRKLEEKAKLKNMTIIPVNLKVAQLVKITVALGRGKKNYDKRQSIKDKDLKRQTARNGYSD
jgi:SsrA-binding protein